jgi:hypothetical protein
MFSAEIVESMLFIALISGGIIWYGIVAGREDEASKAVHNNKFEQDHGLDAAGLRA